MNCPHCQAPLRPGKAYCGKCGKPAGSAISEPHPFISPPPPPPPPQGRIIPPQLPPLTTPPPRGFDQGSGSGFGERIWDILSVSGATAVSGTWYWYTGLAARSGADSTSPDYLSCLLIVLLPILGIIFRKPLDQLLLRLQPAMGKLPSRVRLGVGLALPFLVSSHLFASGVGNYPLMTSSTLFGTVLTFIVLRIPKGTPSNQR